MTRDDTFRDRFLISLIVLLGTSWFGSLLNEYLALVGPFAAGAAFLRYRAGVRKRSVITGAVTAAGAVGVMVVGILVVTWFVLTATSEPGEAANLLEALVNFESKSDIIRSSLLFGSGAIALAAAGGSLSAWLHSRQLDSEYWVSE